MWACNLAGTGLGESGPLGMSLGCFHLMCKQFSVRAQHLPSSANCLWQHGAGEALADAAGELGAVAACKLDCIPVSERRHADTVRQHHWGAPNLLRLACHAAPCKSNKGFHVLFGHSVNGTHLFWQVLLHTCVVAALVNRLS